MLYIMIRKAVEQAIGLLMSASTQRLLSTGLHNTVEELIEGHLSNQKVRLRTAVGNRMLHQIGWAAQNVTPLDVLPDSWRLKLKMLPLLRNMNPSHDEGHRKARAQALNTTLGGDHAVIYTDASKHRGQQYAIIVATSRTNLLACTSLRTQEMTAAEEAAITLALTQPGVRRVVTDSQQAYWNYQSGWVS